MRTAPFKKNGPIALTTGRDVCEVFWKQYLNQGCNWHRATSWEKATCGTTYCHTSSGQQHSDRLQYQKTAIQCKSLVHREGVDDDLRRGHEKTAPIWRKSPGLPWRGGRRSEERTQEDRANQTRVPWSTVKGWTTIWGEDTRRPRQSDASPLVHREGVDDDLRRGHKKTAPIRHESPGPPWRGGWRSEERTQEDSAIRRKSPGPPWRGGRWPEERTRCHSDASPLVHREVVDDNLRRLRTLHREQKNADEVSTNNYSWVVKLSMQTVSVTQNWPLLN